MYGWIFRHLPGPLWVRILSSVVIVAAVIAALFQVGFPWLSDVMEINDPTIGALDLRREVQAPVH